MYALNAGVAITTVYCKFSEQCYRLLSCFSNFKNFRSSGFQSMNHSIICFGSMWAGACWVSSVVLVNTGIVSDTFIPGVLISVQTGISSETT